MDKYRLVAKLNSQAFFRVTDGPANHFLNKRSVGTVHVHLPHSVKFSASPGCYHLYHGTHDLKPAKYINVEKGTQPSYSQCTPTCVPQLFSRLEPPPLVQYYRGRVQPRLFSFQTTARYFPILQVSTNPKFTAGLQAFRRNQFLESAQNFNKLCDAVQQLIARQKLKTNSHLIPKGCLAAALFRQGAYERAEAVSRQILRELQREEGAAVGQSACFSAFRAFAVVVASSAAFECRAQKQESRVEQTCAVDSKGKENKAIRPEKHQTFSPLQLAKVCISSALGKWKTEFPPKRPEEGISFRELRILRETLARAATPSTEENTGFNRTAKVEDGLFFDFLNLIESYNNFILRVYSFLAATLATGNAMGLREKEYMRCLLLAVETLLNGIAAMEAHLEEHKQKSEISRTSQTLSSSETPRRELHERKMYGKNRKGQEFADPSSRKGPEGEASCAAFIDEEYAEQAAMGVIQMCRGVGASLMRMSATESCDTPFIALATGGVTTDVFAMGQAVLKKGLTLCKLHTENSCRMAKGGLLANLAASFHRCGEAIVSEGLFRSALIELGASTGLQAEWMTGDADKLRQSRVQTHSCVTPQARVDEWIQGPRVAEKTCERWTALLSHLTFADRFEYASTMLQYSFLLDKWEGREFEAEKLRETAAKLSPLLQHKARKSMLECWVFSLLWKPPISVATCMTAAASENL